MIKLIISYLEAKFNKIIKNKEAISALILGLIAAIVCLSLTFSVLLSIIIFMLFVASTIFKESFSNGWLFMLSIALIFPFIKISSDIYLFQMIIFVIILLSILQLIYEGGKFEIGKVSFCFILLILIGFSLQMIAPLFGGTTQKQVQEIFLNFILIGFLLLSFQYFFHTKKRINRFILLLIIIGFLHAIVGLSAVFLGWHNSLEIGVSHNLNNQIFLEKFGQLNGIWGSDINDKVGINSVASFLSITILLTISRLIISYKNKLQLKQKGEFFSTYLLWFVLAMQVFALIMTHSYLTFVIAGISATIAGILLKNRKFITISIIWTIVFSFIISKFQIENSINIDWVQNFRSLNSWFMGNGIFFEKGTVINQNIQNSYFFLWNYYGIFSVLILLTLFYYFFMALYNNYRIVSGENKITLIIITAIFICIILEAFRGNILFFGPTAVVFWLFYAVAINFRKDALEKKIVINKIFYRFLGHAKKIKSIDSIKKPMF